MCYTSAGVLGPPQNLRSVEENSTHLTIQWDDPPSLFGSEDTTYHLVFFLEETATTINANATLSSYSLLRLSTLTAVQVTTLNPVGEGGKNTLNWNVNI